MISKALLSLVKDFTQYFSNKITSYAFNSKPTFIVINFIYAKIIIKKR